MRYMYKATGLIVESKKELDSALLIPIDDKYAPESDLQIPEFSSSSDPEKQTESEDANADQSEDPADIEKKSQEPEQKKAPVKKTAVRKTAAVKK
ncbi:MAG: hypothetical protein Q4B85_06645 [Lachnospiraceae bacterium]|nr:hypothetical protein [Lachnospiraceae bacterium]